MKLLLKAMNIELTDGRAPEWVELIPPGPKVEGFDGRWWLYGPEEQRAVFGNFKRVALDLPIDREHATEIKGANGEEAPAAAWIVELADRNGDGGCWGRVDWNERGRAQVEAKEYRYLSPVFYYTQDRRIRALESAGLTNKPNLRLAALNRQAANMEDDTMNKALCRLLGLDLEEATEQQIQDAVAQIQNDLALARNREVSKELLAELGLADDAGPDQALAKTKEMKAANRSGKVNTQLYAPRDELNKAINRAEEAEKALKDRDAADREDKIEKAVNRALSEGKVAPASKEFYLASCRKDGGLEEFEKFLESAPKLISDPQLPDEPEAGSGSLSDADKAVCRSLGLDETEFAKARKEDK